MTRRLGALFALALALVLLAAGTAAAQEGGKKEKEALVFLLGCLTVFPLATFLPGLAFHLFLRGVAPARTRRLTRQLETGFFRTLVFGVVDTVIVLLVVGGTAEKAQPISLFFLLLLGLASFVGLHGISRGLGARILGASEGPRPETKELVVGWFVLSFVGWFPVIGWLYALACAIRGVGGIVLQAFTSDEDA